MLSLRYYKQLIDSYLYNILQHNTNIYQNISNNYTFLIFQLYKGKTGFGELF